MAKLLPFSACYNCTLNCGLNGPADPFEHVSQTSLTISERCIGAKWLQSERHRPWSSGLGSQQVSFLIHLSRIESSTSVHAVDIDQMLNEMIIDCGLHRSAHASISAILHGKAFAAD